MISLRKSLNLTSISKNMCATTGNTRKCILSIVYAHSFYAFFPEITIQWYFQKLFSNILLKSPNYNLSHFETTFSTQIQLDSTVYFTYQIKSFLVQGHLY